MWEKLEVADFFFGFYTVWLFEKLEISHYLLSGFLKTFFFSSYESFKGPKI